MSIMEIEAVPYELTDTPPERKRDVQSTCEPNPEHQIPLSKVSLKYCKSVDPKSEIGDVIVRNHPWNSEIPR